MTLHYSTRDNASEPLCRPTYLAPTTRDKAKVRCGNCKRKMEQDSMKRFLPRMTRRAG